MVGLQLATSGRYLHLLVVNNLLYVKRIYLSLFTFAYHIACLGNTSNANYQLDRLRWLV